MNQKHKIAEVFLKESNDGLVSSFEDKIAEHQDEIKRLHRKRFKKDPEWWEFLIKPVIEKHEKEIRRYEFLIKKIITYNQKKLKTNFIDVDRLLERVDIVKIIEQYTHLTHHGHEFKGRCPFHNEKNPSFYVNPKKQLYHCFGCGSGGNVITFLTKIEGWTFKETIKYLNENSYVR